MSNNNNHNEEQMTTPQQPEQAETPLAGEVMPEWVASRIEAARYLQGVKNTSCQGIVAAAIWLADALATLTTEYERLEAQSAAERRRTATAEKLVVMLTNQRNRAEADTKRLDWMHRHYAAFECSHWTPDRVLGDNDVTVRWVRFYDDGRPSTDESVPWMQTMGLDGLARHDPEVGEVVISIGSPGERLPGECNCYADILRVEFADDQFDGWEKRGRNLSPSDARRIVRFVKKHRRSAPRLTIHCTAGASRSVSVAQALATALNIPHPHAFILNYGAYFRVYDAARQLGAPPEPGL